MSYKKTYNLDNDYQKIINEYEAAKNDLKRKANYRTYKFETLLEEASQIHSKLSDEITKHWRARKTKMEETIERLQNIQKNVGYADRPNEAKEFEMRYKLADNHELKNMVQDLNSDDLLEINLLRMELKDRGMNELDQQVKYYVMHNKLDGMDEIEQKEYDYCVKKLSTYNTMGHRAVVIDDEIIPLVVVKGELRDIAKTTDAGK